MREHVGTPGWRYILRQVCWFVLFCSIQTYTHAYTNVNVVKQSSYRGTQCMATSTSTFGGRNGCYFQTPLGITFHTHTHTARGVLFGIQPRAEITASSPIVTNGTKTDETGSQFLEDRLDFSADDFTQINERLSNDITRINERLANLSNVTTTCKVQDTPPPPTTTTPVDRQHIQSILESLQTYFNGQLTNDQLRKIILRNPAILLIPSFETTIRPTLDETAEYLHCTNDELR
eukprot:CAMPEP_0194365252 /NCGR_PEP_ID=MMETSP0174-20130528/13254_1 /TAXON_ID=216777 /ORGANISM="Proboscia alata, Strain PI-D3" /LENGTH=232 /DNA_ID=CAMNT_0039139807 /DNA_START=65 /DNA_END=759 /DNA_ORIENTATION=-